LEREAKAFGYGGSEIDLVGSVRLRVKVANHTRDTEFFISVKKEQQVILGRDWFDMMGYMAMDTKRGYVQFANSSSIPTWPIPRMSMANE